MTPHLVASQVRVSVANAEQLVIYDNVSHPQMKS